MAQLHRLVLLAAVAFAHIAAAGSAVAQPPFPVPATDDDAGFESIFDGKTLNGWEGDPKYWRVEDGCLVGVVTPETVMKQNSFIIWRGGVTRDFELKVQYRVSSRGNSGINYRSVEIPGQPWAMRGYQCDIDGEDKWTGHNYDEKAPGGRGILALRGQVTRVLEGKRPQIIGTVGEKEALEMFLRKEDWNDCHIIARGNIMVHMVNGHVTSVVIDDDVKNRRMEGQLGVQVHVGPPMKIEYRNFRIKHLASVDAGKP
ncbi:MAG: 3-keto-disaccharide hydrolase [Planctomycetaceae bacterium]